MAAGLPGLERRLVGGGLAVSADWDRDAAHAFVEDLFARHHAEIHAYLLRMLRDPELAADLTQDAFVKAYRAYATLEDPSTRGRGSTGSRIGSRSTSCAAGGSSGSCR